MLDRTRHVISDRGLDFIKGFEAFVGYVYDDLAPMRRIKGKLTYPEWDGGPVHGTLTIGYGHTDAAKHELKIKQGLRITEREACQVLGVDLDETEAAVNRNVRVPLTQGQFDALVSFAFNCGVGNLNKLIIPLNRGDYDGTRAKFDLYTRSKGRVLTGLQRRRDGEQALWDARYGDAAPPKTIVETPKDVEAPASPSIVSSKIAQGSTAGIAGGASEAIASVNDTAGQVADMKRNADDIGIGDFFIHLAQNPRFWIGVGIVVVCGLIIYWRWRDHR